MEKLPAGVAHSPPLACTPGRSRAASSACASSSAASLPTSTARTGLPASVRAAARASSYGSRPSASRSLCSATRVSSSSAESAASGSSTGPSARRQSAGLTSPRVVPEESTRCPWAPLPPRKLIAAYRRLPLRVRTHGREVSGTYSPEAAKSSARSPAGRLQPRVPGR